MPTLYKKSERQGTISFIPITISKGLKDSFKTIILKDKLSDDLALYLAKSTSGKTYKEIAKEIMNQVFLKGDIDE